MNGEFFLISTASCLGLLLLGVFTRYVMGHYDEAKVVESDRDFYKAASELRLGLLSRAQLERQEAHEKLEVSNRERGALRSKLEQVEKDAVKTEQMWFRETRSLQAELEVSEIERRDLGYALRASQVRADIFKRKCEENCKLLKCAEFGRAETQRQLELLRETCSQVQDKLANVHARAEEFRMENTNLRAHKDRLERNNEVLRQRLAGNHQR